MKDIDKVKEGLESLVLNCQRGLTAFSRKRIDREARQIDALYHTPVDKEAMKEGYLVMAESQPEMTREEAVSQLAGDLALLGLAEWIAIEHGKTRLQSGEYMEEAQGLADLLYVMGYSLTPQPQPDVISDEGLLPDAEKRTREKVGREFATWFKKQNWNADYHGAYVIPKGILDFKLLTLQNPFNPESPKKGGEE